MATSPTQRTLAALRKQGRRCAIVERWNMYGGVRQDMFGIIDIVALEPPLTHDGVGEIVGIPSTGTAFAPHQKAMLEEPDKRQACIDSLRAGGRLELWGWRKVKAVKKDGTKGKAYRYQPRVRTFDLEDFKVGSD